MFDQFLRFLTWLRDKIAHDPAKERVELFIGRYYDRPIDEEEANRLLVLSPEEAAKKNIDHKLHVLRVTGHPDHSNDIASNDSEDLRGKILHHAERFKRDIPSLRVRFHYDEANAGRANEQYCDLRVIVEWEPLSLGNLRLMQREKVAAMLDYLHEDYRREARARGLEIGWVEKLEIPKPDEQTRTHR